MLHRETDQAALVATYFDSISAGYRARYSEQNPFHEYFFKERLRIATAGFDFEGKTILDIGAGTGALYDRLRDIDDLDYWACDISPQMLSHSSIPQQRILIGPAPLLQSPRERFDFIFSLGVTSYQTTQEMNDDLHFIARRLTEDGTAIVTFTHRRSLDHLARSALRLVRPLAKRGVIGQAFPMFAYSADEIQTAAQSAGLSVTKTIFMNHTISPFNVLLPKPSVAISRLIERRPVPLLSADIVTFLKRK